MKVLILQQHAALTRVGGFAPLSSELIARCFTGKDRVSVFPDTSLIRAANPHHIAEAFNEAVRNCDVLIAVVKDPSTTLGTLIERALSKKKFVGVLIPSHLRGTIVDHEIQIIKDWDARPMTRAHYPYEGDGVESTIQAIEKLLAVFGRFDFGRSGATT